MIKFSEKAQRGLIRFQQMQKSAGIYDGFSADASEPKDSAGLSPSAYDAVENTMTPAKVDRNKVDMSSANPWTGDVKIKEPPKPDPKEKPWLSDRAKSYLGYAGASAGMGALIGSLIQLVRGKNIFSGALVGAGIGGGLGAAHRYGLEASEDYAKDNSLEKHLFQPMWDKIDSWSSGTNA